MGDNFMREMVNYWMRGTFFMKDNGGAEYG